MTVRLTQDEQAALIALGQETRPSEEYRSFAGIAQALEIYGLDWDRARIRRACRSLARKGLAEYMRGLWTEDGEMAGAGYGITKAGVERLKEGVTLPAAETNIMTVGHGEIADADQA